MQRGIASPTAVPSVPYRGSPLGFAPPNGPNADDARIDAIFRQHRLTYVGMVVLYAD